MEYYIIVYKNTYDAMNAEKIFNEKKFSFRIMPTPTSITQSCGICTRFDEKKDIDDILENNIVEFKNIYHKNKCGFDILR